jgi:general secretion pathway protein F
MKAMAGSIRSHGLFFQNHFRNCLPNFPSAPSCIIPHVQTFEYIALSSAGVRVTGELAGPTEQAVLAELEARKLVPVSVAPKAARLGLPLLRRRSISARKLGTSYRQIAELLHAGVPLLRALRLLANRRSDPRTAAVFRDLAEAVAGGEDLAGSMSKKPEAFPVYHVAMVRAGEKGGFLENVMSRLGQVVLKQAELRSQIAGSLIYPAVLVGAGGFILIAVFALFVPKFRKAFPKNIELPALTKLVLGIGEAVSTYGLLTAALLIVAAVAGFVLSRRAAVKRRIVAAKTNAPVIGPIVRALAAARFCRLLGTMMASGVPMLAAMNIAKDAAGNTLFEEAIDKAAEAVRAGQPLAGPLNESGLFEDDVIEMISVAETANNLETVLVNIAETLETRVDRLLGVALRLLEPLMILTIAVIVATVAAGLLLPMTRLG